jgi:hypothetical protein
MNACLKLAAAFAGLTLAGFSANAQQYDFHLTEFRDFGNAVSTWVLPASPSGMPGFGYGDNYFGFFPGPQGIFQGDPGQHPLYFTDDYFDDGTNVYGFLLIDLDHGPSSAFGSKVFTGELSDPTFIKGTYDFVNGDKRFTLVISEGAVPEPATWVIFIAGFGLVGAVARRRMARGSTLSG